MMQRIILGLFLGFIAGGFLSSGTALASKSNQIDEAVYYAYNSMSEAQIASWISSNFPASCLLPQNYPAEYYNNSAWRNVTFKEPHSYFTYGGETSPARIIWRAAQFYSLNPRVIITTLEKESDLVSGSKGCSAWRYNSAMGYNCWTGAENFLKDYPNIGIYQTCVQTESYAGFSPQVNKAAWQLSFDGKRANGDLSWMGDGNVTYYGRMTQGWRARVNGGAQSYYDGYTTINGEAVYLENGPTAALYNYTPFFTRFETIYTNWFGPTTSLLGSLTLNTIAQPNPNPARGETVTYTFSLTNTLSTPVTLDAVGLVGRAGSLTGANRDFGWQQGPITLQPNTPQQFTFTSTLRDLGTMYAWPAVLYQGTYTQYNNWGTTLQIHAPNFSLSQPLTSTPSLVYAGQDVTFTAKLKNNEPYPINYDAIGIPVKFYDHYNYDAVWVGPGVVAPGAEITLSGMRNIDKPGPFSYWVSNYFSGTYSTVGSVKKFDALHPTPSFSVSGLNFNTTSPAQGSSIGTSFTVTNNLPVPIDVEAVGVVGRFNTFTGPNRDIGWQGPVHFNAGETKTFSGYSRTITDAGTHYYWIGILDEGKYIQYNNWGSTIISRAPNFSVSGLNFNTTSPIQGSNIEASFTVTNNLPVPIDTEAVGVVGRFGTFSGPNRDIGWQGPVHFNAGETKAFSGYSRTVTDIGTHYYWIGVLNAGRFIQYNNWGSTIISRAP